MRIVFKSYGLFPLMAALFLTVNLAYFSQAIRLISIDHIVEPGSFFIFPLTFLFADILTEVYGYRQTRQLIWINLICFALFTGLVLLSIQMPSASLQAYGLALQRGFGAYPHLLFSVALAGGIGYFVNGFLLAKMKLWCEGRWYWMRALVSTSVAEALFTAIWVVVFYGFLLTTDQLLDIIVSLYLYKMVFELLALPLSVWLVKKLKRWEKVDVYDDDTRFTPFSF